MTRVLYTGDSGMVTIKVCSWCMSRLGGSPAVATRNTPPRCGFSSARAHGAAHNPAHITMTHNHACILPLLITKPPSLSLPQHGSMGKQNTILHDQAKGVGIVLLSA